MKAKSRHEYFMSLALAEAAKGKGRVSPNPVVGCVIAKSDKIMARAFHTYDGLAHAEAKAIDHIKKTYSLSRAKKILRSSTLYVSLEPCVSFGRTAPCVHKILDAGIKTVVVGCTDPNPKHQGRGIKMLRRRGVRVLTGVLKAEAQAQNEAFFKAVKTGMPFIVLKMAGSLDGKIATRSGDARWISSKESREFVQQLRAESDGILVGASSVLLDNPRLTLRPRGPGKILTRIILDKEGRVIRNARKLLLFRSCRLKTEEPVVIFTLSKNRDSLSAKYLLRKGVRIEGILSRGTGTAQLKSILRRVRSLGLNRVLVEGGSQVSTSFLEAELVDRGVFFIAPKLIGGQSALTLFEGRGAQLMKQSQTLKSIHIKRFGDDICFIGSLSAWAKPIKN